MLWQLAAISTWSSIPVLGRYHAPTLLICGEHDRVVPRANSRLIAARIPKARLVTIQAGHDLQSRAQRQPQADGAAVHRSDHRKALTMLDRRNQLITTVLNGAERSAAVPVGAYAQVMPGIDLSTVTFPKRLAVVNRGEAAVRLIRAVRELNAEYGCGITTVALHTDAERRAMFVRQADEAVTLRRTSSGIAYLDHTELERALLEARADAVWVGWGFVAEDIAFAELCVRMNLTSIGPPPAAMRTLGDKVEAKFLAEKVGVPLAPWSRGPVETREDARRHAEEIGYPLIIKARSGGGGRGIRKVFAADELEVALERTQGEAQRSFGDPVVFIERLVTEARHVEVQIMADNYGNVWAPGVRDCSIQRKNQKVIEESSSPVLTKGQADHLRRVSTELVRAAGYRGAGTVEYLYQPDQKVFTFLEVNTRLQVEHPITEVTTGIDLVKLQILVAGGASLVGECPPEFGHAVEARLNAEDADNAFAPAPGTVRLLRFPLGSGLRVDTGIAQGDVIPPDYDSMVAKVIAWGRDRSEAFARLRTGLHATTVVIDGGTTNKSFLLDLLDRRRSRLGIGRHRLARSHRRGIGANAYGAGRHRTDSCRGRRIRGRRESRTRGIPGLCARRSTTRHPRHRP